MGVRPVLKAIVFDFDGLILDTEEPVYRSWLEVYQAHGEDLPFERWVQIVGSTNTLFHPQYHLEERLGKPLPKEVLERRIGRRTEMVLDLAVLDCLDVKAAEAIAIEDSPNGIAAAKRAGMRCVAIPNPITAGLDLSEADVTLASLGDVTLADLLEKLDQL